MGPGLMSVEEMVVTGTEFVSDGKTVPELDPEPEPEPEIRIAESAPGAGIVVPPGP
jgi:hypothetical protein